MKMRYLASCDKEQKKNSLETELRAVFGVCGQSTSSLNPCWASMIGSSRTAKIDLPFMIKGYISAHLN